MSYNTDEHTPSIISDLTLKVEEVVTGLDLPTTMAFLSPNDILVLEKIRVWFRESLMVQCFQDHCSMLMSRLLLRDVCVEFAVSKNGSNIGSTYVFLYFTEAQVTDSEDVIQGKIH